MYKKVPTRASPYTSKSYLVCVFSCCVKMSWVHRPVGVERNLGAYSDFEYNSGERIGMS
jgi:hypothetical protein